MARSEKAIRFPFIQFLGSGTLILVAAALGIVCGLLDIAAIYSVAEAVGELFIRLLKLVSTPIIFFSVLSTLTGMANLHDAGVLGGRVIRYTLLTTIIAATIALLLFLLINPTGQVDLSTSIAAAELTESHSGYWQYVIEIIPTSFITPFLEGQVISVLFIALVLSLAILNLPIHRRERLQMLFEDLFAAIMKLTAGFLKLLPLAVWAFVTTFIESLARESVGSHLLLYFTCILLANVVQAVVILPLLLASKGISPVQTFQGMAPALTVAFFSKSSSAALPAAMDAAQTRLGISSRVARFSFPLCTTINMNACAGFILITVLFVSMLSGMTFTVAELAAWVVISSIAAVGNAGVPMGCFLLASTLLATMNVPLELMGVILPVYALVDMLESAINVWSDACVTSIVDKETA
ncbi:dicarboxylate/amino acid:cation symporter [Sansalvadorimonas verongulae]|uniref:dicarboxylate/amino acid:cation symporter n=1 Tax=Sansalvadorimonas verongulae TaxID=2172824 RepID=UPI0012BBF6F4|nr:dicarboxylate/amino acid:cation symporter [Sansalvadorimonas verongulae]MTI15455.1 dicarboxylate/amino acid:cation symporter [Sansalvadorimonas verongulae]